MFKVTQENKKKADKYGLIIYRGFLSLGMATIIFGSGMWKANIENRTFESIKQKYEYIQYVQENTKHRLNNIIHMERDTKDSIYVTRKEYEPDIKKILAAIKLNGKK